jgi:hypothetical protein
MVIAMLPPWRRKPERPSPVYVGSHDDRMTRIRALHVEPDDDRPSREDRQRAEDYRDSCSWRGVFGARRR